MNTNSFINWKNLLPVNIISKNDEINYYFNQDAENSVFGFLKTEMPGIIVGDIDEDIISVSKDGNILKIFQGQCYSEYFEPIDSDRSIGTIKEIFSTDNPIKFYTQLFNYRTLFSTVDMKELEIMTLEDMFYNELKFRGFEKLKIREYHDAAFKISYIIFRNQEGKEIEVIYPEGDYDEGNVYNYFMPEFNPNWLVFFKSLKKGDVLTYSGITFK